jgi:hypothetical protein
MARPGSMRYVQAVVLSALLFASTSAMAQGNKWVPVTGADNLREYMSGLTAERELARGEMSRGEYRADGTGTLYSWGAAIPRTWTVKSDDQICVTAERATNCYQLERNAADKDLYRVRDVATGRVDEFRLTDGRAAVTGEPKAVGNEGAASAPSAAEMAAELSNPNSSVATMTFKNQFRWFEGDLPDADGQSSYTLLFQPGLPFVLSSGAKILWRPAIPIIVDQPVFNAGTGKFEGKSGLGDIAFDLAYAPKVDPSLMLAFGFITSLPTATNDLGTDRWTLGPELLIGKITPKWLLGMFPNHQWDIAGSGDADINMTSIQAFYTYLLGGGWSVGTGPTMTYNWESEQWTVPLQINAGKTVVWGGRPWKLSAEVNYYVEKADAFGPEWMFSFNIAPVVKNGLASLFGLGDN